MKRRTTVFLIAACAVAVILAGTYSSRKTAVNKGSPTAPASGGYPAQPPASSAPTFGGYPAVNPAPKVATTDALGLVRLYFSSLQAGNFRAAYACLSPDLQKTLGYQAFTAGFKGSRVTGYNFSSLQVVGAGNFSLTVTVPYTLSGPAGNRSSVATLRCVDLSGGYGKPDWKVQAVSMEQAGTQKP